MGSIFSGTRSRNRRARVFLSTTASTLLTTGLLGTASANADVYSYHWDRPDGFDGTVGPTYVSDEAGTVLSVTAEFDTDTNQLTFLASFEAEAGTGQLPVGFFLVVNDGPDPKGIDSEYAVLYFDAMSDSSPILSAYAYNGENGADSFFDGQLAAGNQTPDPIISSINDSSWVISASSVDNSNTRILSFTIDVSPLVDHSPMYGDDASWFGMGFEETIGIWLHTYSLLNPEYGADGFFLPDASGDSFLSWNDYADLGEQFHGWFDASDEQTESPVIPEPATMMLIGTGLASLLGRRR